MKNKAGRKPFNGFLKFKILVLQSLYELSDHQMEFQIKDRLSIMRFLGFRAKARITDEKTIWPYREILAKGGFIKPLFDDRLVFIGLASSMSRTEKPL